MLSIYLSATATAMNSLTWQTGTTTTSTITTKTTAHLSSSNPASSSYQYATSTIDTNCMTDLECQAYVCNSEIQKATVAIMAISLVANGFCLAGWIYRRRMKRKMERECIAMLAETNHKSNESNRSSVATMEPFSPPIQRAKMVEVSPSAAIGRGADTPATKGALGTGSVPGFAAPTSDASVTSAATRSGPGGMTRSGDSIGVRRGRGDGPISAANSRPRAGLGGLGIDRGDVLGGTGGGLLGAGRGRGNGGLAVDGATEKLEGEPRSGFTPYRKPVVEDEVGD